MCLGATYTVIANNLQPETLVSPLYVNNFCTPGRNRTGMPKRGILSPLCLPISPRARII